MMKGPILLAVSFVINIALVFFLTTVYLENKDYAKCYKKNRWLHAELARSKELLQKKTDAMSMCVKAAIGVKTDFDPMFHSVEEASLMEVTIYSDTESGEPRKFVIQGCKTVTE